MKPRLIPCSNCERYVRCDEAACPFCRAALLGLDVPRSIVSALPGLSSAGLSRAAVFAMRTALVAAAAPALGCGGEEGTRTRDTEQDMAAAAAGAAGAVGSGGSGQAGAGAANSTGGSSTGGSPSLIALGGSPSDDVADAGADAEPFAPVPIYGGVFPDPMSRARV